MSEEEKKAIEYLEQERAYAYKFDNRKIKTITTIALKLIRNRQKDLNNLKEIEKKHQEVNGKLRVELEQEKEKNKELEATLKQTQNSWFEDTQKIEQEKEKISDLKYQLYHKQQMIDELTQDEEKLKIELGKEKEKNKELEKHYKHEQEYINGEVFSAKQMHLIDEDYISKDKIREKIKELKEEIKLARKEKDLVIVAELEIQVDILKQILEEK